MTPCVSLEKMLPKYLPNPLYAEDNCGYNWSWKNRKGRDLKGESILATDESCKGIPWPHSDLLRASQAELFTALDSPQREPTAGNSSYRETDRKEPYFSKRSSLALHRDTDREEPYFSDRNSLALHRQRSALLFRAKFSGLARRHRQGTTLLFRAKFSGPTETAKGIVLVWWHEFCLRKD